MDNLNQLNIKELNNTNLLGQAKKQLWLDVINIDNEKDRSQKYADICQRHQFNNKWILMINPDSEPLAMLSLQSKIDASRILKVNANKVKVDLTSIESALIKGNCAAIILCNASLEQEQIEQLTLSAKKGQTPCIVLTDHSQKKHPHLH